MFREDEVADVNRIERAAEDADAHAAASELRGIHDRQGSEKKRAESTALKGGQEKGSGKGSPLAGAGVVERDAAWRRISSC